jgi:hypothetical protein
MGQGQSCVVDVLEPCIRVAGVLQLWAPENGDGHCHATAHYYVTVVFDVYFKLLSSTCYTASHCNLDCVSPHSFPDNGQGLVLEYPGRA